MKNIIFKIAILFLSIFIFACKKDNKETNITNNEYDYEAYAAVVNESSGPYSYTDKNITANDMIDNYLFETGAQFSINIYEAYDEANKEWIKGVGLVGGVVDINSGSEDKIPTAYLKINNNKLLPNLFGTDYLYLYYDSNQEKFAEYQEYKGALFPLIYNPSAKFELFDTDESKIIEFITHTPMPLKANFTAKSLARGNVNNAILKWQPDPNNKIGIFIGLFSFSFAGGASLDYYFLEDDGYEDLSQILNQYAPNSIGSTTMKVKRGVILKGEGKDGITYRFNAITEFTYNMVL